MVSVSESQEIRRITRTEDWPKSYAIYGRMRQDPDRPTLFATTDKKAHSRRKRLMSSMFGIKHVRTMEPLMKGCIQPMVQKISDACDGSSDGTAVVDMQHLIHGVALDIMGITIFGERFGTVENEDHPLPKKMKAGMRIAVISRLMPWLLHLRILPRIDLEVQRLTAEIINKRRATLDSAPQSDLLQKLVEAIDESPGSSLRSEDVQYESRLLLAAGSETTANAALFTLLNLVKSPEAMRKLRKELDLWYPLSDSSRETSCAYSQAGIVYLQACMDEAMRITPGQATGSAREAANDSTILGYDIPTGTTVFPNTQGAHLDGRIWPEPDRFIPDRWLDIYKGQQANDTVYFPFSAGTRICLGKHFALQEMHLILVMLLREFEFEHIAGQDEDTAYRVAQQLRAPVYNFKVRRVSK